MKSTLIYSCVVLSMLLGCGKDEQAKSTQGGAGGATEPGHSEKFRKMLGNPAPAELAEGERIYYEEAFGTEEISDWPPADFLVELWKKDKAKWGEQFSKYGWLIDPGDDLPVGLKRGFKDPTKVHETCAACHVARTTDDRIWSGMPANDLDWARFRLDVDDAWVKAGFSSLLNPKSVEKNKLIQQRGSLDSSSFDDPRSIPTDFPLYVNLGVRHNLGYTGAGGDARSQIFLSIFTFGAGDTLPFPGPEITGPLVDYMSWMAPPTPKDFDADAATRGKAVFDAQRCGSCHHVDDLSKDKVAELVETGPELVPGDDPEHPNGTIATDGAFYGLSDVSGPDGGGPGPGLIKLLQFIGAHKLKVGFTNGYAVTDLHGLFTSAPYLHNGAVPTLDALLMPAAERPTTFTRHGRDVDTTKPGMSNAGHEFGTTLPANEKADLVAYLLSL